MALLTVVEKVELAAIGLAASLAAWLGPAPRLQLELGELIASAALLLLGQGSMHDLWLLYRARQRPAAGPAKEAACLCVESALGFTGILAGIGLAALGLTHSINLSPGKLSATAGTVLLLGFLLKDFVFEWSPWRIYREKDHAQVIFRWRR